jgi:hypothetical protein
MADAHIDSIERTKIAGEYKCRVAKSLGSNTFSPFHIGFPDKYKCFEHESLNTLQMPGDACGSRIVSANIPESLKI